MYLRPLNGLRLDPPPPRKEAGADIAPEEWIALRLKLEGPCVSAEVNGIEVLRLKHTRTLNSKVSVARDPS